ncbi:hypothetical protein BKA56DRAFT_669843 [Ilyonectria sp. MPI-CAGE-AT-0026]|nr:hypothetical protein BKA56DRAFT_669843 [Ilyonectria sp. MPI-CAGE-AT-0026]
MTGEDFADCIADPANSLVEVNSVLGLEDPALPIYNLFDAWEALQFADRGLSEIFESDLVPPLSNGQTTAPHGQKDVGISSVQILPSPVSSFSTASCPPESRGSFFIEDDQYRNAKLNYDSFSTTERVSRFRFPSKFAASRFVRGFFEYMAPHMPIVHAPTFDIASTPPPLLIQIMACGALFANEPAAAQDLHTVALLLMREHDEMALMGERDNNFQLWALQASLLICYFGAFSGDSQRETRAAQTLSETMKLADEAIKQIEISETATYEEWVQQETLNRCLASGIILGGALFSKSPNRCFSLSILDARFPLPSSSASWLQAKAEWQRPDRSIYSTDALNMILDGRRIALHPTSFGFTTITSAVVCYICVFESLVGAQHLDLFASFVEKMDRPVQMLKDTWKEQSSAQFLIESTMTQMEHTTRSMILSMSYHLYGSRQLMTMKTFFENPDLLDRPGLEQPFHDRHSGSLEKALIMAAEMLRSDCQTGLGYIKSLGNLRFAPVSVIAPYEGVLLLCWYLQNKEAKLSPDPILDKLINDALSESEDSIHSPASLLAAFPLAVYADLFNSSVWQSQLDVSRRLTLLIEQLEHIY